jgi:hypothetical protein
MKSSDDATALVGMPGIVVGVQEEVDGEWWPSTETAADVAGWVGCRTRALVMAGAGAWSGISRSRVAQQFWCSLGAGGGALRRYRGASDLGVGWGWLGSWSWARHRGSGSLVVLNANRSRSP